MYITTKVTGMDIRILKNMLRHMEKKLQVIKKYEEREKAGRQIKTLTTAINVLSEAVADKPTPGGKVCKHCANKIKEFFSLTH